MSCSYKPISGYIELDKNDIHPMVYIIEPQTFSSLVSSYEGKIVDSTTINDKGNFEFASFPLAKEDKIYLLTIQKIGEKYGNKLVNEEPDSSNYIPFVLKANGYVKINAKASDMISSANITGNINANKDILQLIKTKIQLHKKYHNTNNIDEHNLMEYEASIYNFQKDLVNSSISSNNVLVQCLALRWASPTGDYERIPELLKQTLSSVEKIDPNHPWTLQLDTKSKKLPLTIGDTFPDFELPMENGKKVNISLMLGAKITLIDLWASWCAPCRKENKNTLVPLWDSEYKNGFQIIGYALDSDRDGWQSAIIKDGADRWPHASHLQGDESPIFDSLRITTIPANYLIDSNRKIVAKNLHGDELIQFVKSYIK